MENKTKIILTGLGLAAIIVPAILLVVFSGRGGDAVEDASVNGGNRQIRQDAVQNQLNNTQGVGVASPAPVVPSASPSAIPITSSADHLEGTPASGVN